MPACFQLISKSSGEPTSFTQIDNEICKFLGEEPHSIHFCYGWYDSIGLRVACGETLQQISDDFQQSSTDPNSPSFQLFRKLFQITEFLIHHYTTNAWHQVGK